MRMCHTGRRPPAGAPGRPVGGRGVVRSSAALLDEMTEKLIEKENIDYDELAQMTQAHLNRQLTPA